MNVFVLVTGRCGSKTTARAFEHATNYTATHEGAVGTYYPLDYPPWHIEVDNRLSWMLGALAEKFPEARYVHQLRDREGMARSFEARGDWDGASIRGFGAGILGRGPNFQAERYEAACRMWDVMNANIRQFLGALPPRQVFSEPVWLGELEEQFPDVWEWLGCEGDLAAALAETRVKHNEGQY